MGVKLGAGKVCDRWGIPRQEENEELEYWYGEALSSYDEETAGEAFDGIDF